MKYLALACLAVITTTLATGQDKESYVRQYRDIAISEMHRTGIPASIKLSQAILESNYGRSELAREANNHFGIKCGKSWAGEGYHLKDDDRNARGELVHSCFRVFNSPEESYIAHSEFLTDPAKGHRYGNLFSLDPDDYKGWAYGLQKGGYATNPGYAQLLIRIIEEQKLYEYDVHRIDENLATQYLDRTGKVADMDADQFSYTIRFQNKIPYVVVHEHENVKSLSRHLDIPARKLIRYNTFIENKKSELGDGDRIYLQPLKRKFHGDEKVHVVNPGETLEEIAHFYGIKSKALRKRNQMPDDCQPAPGTRLVLRGRQRTDVHCISAQSILAGTDPKPTTPSPGPQPAEVPGVSVPGRTSDDTRTEGPEIHAASAPGLSEVFVRQALGSYTVQPKDTLYRIASAHGMTVEELKKLNHLTTDVIHPGQSLKVR